MMYAIDRAFKEERIIGKREGKREGKIETAKNLIKMGLTNEQISEATKLKMSDIEKLRK